MAKITQKSFTDKQRLIKKRNGKIYGVNISTKLSLNSPTSTIQKSYKNFYYCTHVLHETANGKIHSTHCKTKMCPNCNRMKSGKLMRMYSQPLSTLDKPVFITLTLPTCEAIELKSQIQKMEFVWRLIYNQTKKAKYKKLYTPFRGFRSLEAKPAKNNRFHPHYHIIINDKKQAKFLQAQWIRHFPQANILAQKIVSVKENTLMELFKYTLKPLVSKEITEEKLYYQALNVCFEALHNKKVFLAFGIKAVKEIKTEREVFEDSSPDDIVTNVYVFKNKTDWYSKKTNVPYVNVPVSEKVKNKY